MARPARPRVLFAAFTLVAVTPVVSGQSPPPRLLPTSITGATEPGGVRPVAGSVPAAPVGRLLANLRAYPPETQSALFATRAAADALYRANLPSGRFAFGAESENDAAQASATLALAEAAAFTGDAKLAARAGGAILSLLTLTEIDPANPGVRRPVATLKGDPTRFAACLALAIVNQPSPVAAQLADAEKFAAYLTTRVKPSGEVEVGTGDPDAVAVTPGVVVEALLAVDQLRPGPAGATAGKIVSYYSQSVKAGVTMTQAAALLPGFVVTTTLKKNDPALVATTFVLADLVARSQVVNGRNGAWVGGFASQPGAEPVAANSALAVRGLSRAAWLTRQVPDLTRFTRYRAATFAGLSFVASRPTEAVGMARAGVAFLQSGAEGAID